MEIDTQALEEFKELYFQEYGKQLTNEQAVDYGTRLVRLVKAIYEDNLPTVRLDKGFQKKNN